MVMYMYRLYPILWVVVVIIINHFLLGLNNEINQFDKILDASITFTSIAIGFIAALLGILITIKDSEIVKRIFEEDEHKSLKSWFYEAFIIGVLLLISTCINYVFLNDVNIWSTLFFYMWLSAIVWFAYSLFRIINVLMDVFFKSNDTEMRPESNRYSDEERQEAKKRLKK